MVDYQARAKQLMDAYEQHGNRDAAAAALGVSPYVFSMQAARCRKAGFDVPRRCPAPICTKEEFRALWDQGLDKREIAAQLGTTLAKVCNFVINHGNEMGIEHGDRRVVKVSQQDYDKACVGARSDQEIAARLGVTVQHMRFARKRLGISPVNKVQAFLDVWQTCNSVAEVAQKTGRSIDCASSLAARGRRLGYPFKRMSGSTR